MADAAKAPRTMSLRHPNWASAFGLLVVLPTFGILAVMLAERHKPIPP